MLGVQKPRIQFKIAAVSKQSRHLQRVARILPQVLLGHNPPVLPPDGHLGLSASWSINCHELKLCWRARAPLIRRMSGLKQRRMIFLRHFVVKQIFWSAFRVGMCMKYVLETTEYGR